MPTSAAASHVIRPHLGKIALRPTSLLTACLIFVGGLAGCGGGGAPAPASGTAGTNPVAPASPAASTSPTTSPAAPAPESTASANPNQKETKWIGNIPYDVFYDQPLNVATDTTSIGTPSSTAMAATSSAGTPASPAAMPAQETPAVPTATPASTGGGAINWGQVLPMPILVEEVKLLRTNLTGNLQTVATFNKAQNPIALDGAMLAAMASVASVHPDQVSWKPNAHFVRDLAFQINENSAGTGREPYTKTKEPFDKALVILDGGKPPEMDSPESVPFSEVVYVADMMKRIEKTFNDLKANINTESRLKESSANAEREMRILLTLATLMGDASYDYSDQEQYKGFLKRFTDGARSGVEAIHTSSLEGFQAALNQMQTTCAECHQQYKGSDSGF